MVRAKHYSRFFFKARTLVSNRLSGAAMVFIWGLPLCAMAMEDESTQWNFDASVGHVQQSTARIQAELNSVEFDTSYQRGPFDFSLSIPWYQKKGEYFIGGIRPRLMTRCERLASLTPVRQQVLINRGKITKQQLNTCLTLLSKLEDINATENGVGDATGFARYTTDINDDGFSANVGLGLKTDSGNEETGLGSGTKDALLEGGISFSNEHYWLNAMVGYDVPSGDKSLDDVYQPQHYFYAVVDGSRRIADWLTLGVTFNAQQAYIKDSDSVESFFVYADIKLSHAVNLHLYGGGYSGSKQAPDSEAGVNLRYSF